MLCKMNRVNIFISRNIYSTCGKWDQILTTKIKKDVEKHWHDCNKKSTAYKPDKMYVLCMFPYPSGNLHMGHLRIYTMSDTLATYYRMLGHNVIHPIGWDAFGLPAENAAIERGHLPHIWTSNNISSMKKQLEMVDCSFDWDREIATCNSKYYKWTQFIFLKMLEKGLAYQNMEFVNWDPKDKTVLADEQVDEFGCSWRSGAKVEKRIFKQWFLKTSAYAESLAKSLDDPALVGPHWDYVAKIQKAWIGKCNGWRFEFQLQDDKESLDIRLPLWTDRPELLFGLTFIAIKPDHFLNAHWKCKSYENIQVLQVSAIHPFTGQAVPIIVSSMTELDETYLGFASCSTRDRDIAKRLELPIIQVIDKLGKTKNSQQFSGMDVLDARKEICKYAKMHKFGGYKTSSQFRDWLISRQRYWGTPIPVIHCPKCKVVPVPYNQLPVLLPKISKPLESKGATSPLSQVDEWVNVPCPKCNGAAKRETDTLDTFMDSSWYFLRYLDPRNETEIFNPDKIAPLLPVDIYLGGKEHELLHLFSARFIFHFLRDEGLVPCQEPFRRLLMMGMITNESFKVKNSGRYLAKDQVEMRGKKLVEKSSGETVISQWEKMSKSKLNGINPLDVFEEYGTDTTRLFVLSDVAPGDSRRWDVSTIKGILHWQSRLWFLIDEYLQPKKNSKTIDNIEVHEKFLFQNRNYAIKQVSHAFNHSYRINVAIKYLQQLTNNLRKLPRELVGHSPEYERSLHCLIVMLAPLAPHFTNELWAGFTASPNSIHKKVGDLWNQKWPQIDSHYLMNFAVKMNGQQISILNISHEDLEKLDKEKAVQLTQSIIENELKENFISQVEFTYYKNFDAQIDYIMLPKLERADKTAG